MCAFVAMCSLFRVWVCVHPGTGMWVCIGLTAALYQGLFVTLIICIQDSMKCHGCHCAVLLVADST